jgi:hypothetical protein
MYPKCVGTAAVQSHCQMLHLAALQEQPHPEQLPVPVQLQLLALHGTRHVERPALFVLMPYCCRVSRREAAACQIYDELVTAAAGSSARRGSSAASPRPTTGSLPWLYYVPGTSYLSAEDVDLQ